jgi:hypothetical protein
MQTALRKIDTDGGTAKRCASWRDRWPDWSRDRLHASKRLGGVMQQAFGLDRDTFGTSSFRMGC